MAAHILLWMDGLEAVPPRGVAPDLMVSPGSALSSLSPLAPLLEFLGLPDLMPDPPLAALAARYLGLASIPGAFWGRVEFTHLLQQRDRLLVLSPHRTGQTPHERSMLCQDLAPVLQADGHACHGGDGGYPLLRLAGPVPGRPASLDVLMDASLLDHLPLGRDDAPLRSIITTAQLVLARHPLNRERDQAGRMRLNTLWLSGLGALPESLAPQPLRAHHLCLAADPALLGAAALQGFATGRLSEDEPLEQWLTALIRHASGCALVYLGAPALLARHGMVSERDALLRQWLDALLPALTGHGQGTLWLVGGAEWPVAGSPAAAQPRPVWVLGKPRKRRGLWRRAPATCSWEALRRQWMVSG
ncbi:MAG: hypothetical protein H7831_07940 [Magnetococcus sp. WYHC-3]